PSLHFLGFVARSPTPATRFSACARARAPDAARRPPPEPKLFAGRSRRPPRRPPRLLSSPRSPEKAGEASPKPPKKKEGVSHFVLVGSQPARPAPGRSRPPPSRLTCLFLRSPDFSSDSFAESSSSREFVPRAIAAGSGARSSSSSYRPGQVSRSSSRRDPARRLPGSLCGRRGAEIHPDLDRYRLLVTAIIRLPF
ncbi:unnamed protein product, partial [Urochloa humidicola]